MSPKNWASCKWVGSFAQPEISDYNQRNLLLWLCLPGSRASSYSLKESSSQTICSEGGGGGTSQKILLLMPKDKKIDTGQARATNMDYRNVLLSTLMGFPDSSVGKESACDAGGPGLIPGSGRFAGEGISYPPTPVFLGFPCGSASKESTCNVGDLGSIPVLGRAPGEGKIYPLQYFGLENSMDCTVHGFTTRVRHDWVTFTFHLNTWQLTNIFL